MILQTINAVVINLSIIVAVTLGLYFYSLKHSLSKNDTDSNHLIVTNNIKLSKSAEFGAGIFIGIMSFIISKHGIPIYNFRPVDVRYLPVFFSVFYGSPLTGVFSASSLIILKCIEYQLRGASITEYMNNIFITLLILTVSIIIYKKKFPARNSVIICLISTIIIRSIFFIIAFHSIFDWLLIIQILINFAIFSVFFLFTGWLIHRVIKISQEIRIYQTASIFDNLTGLYNKESFYFFLDLAYNEAIYEGNHFSLAIIDIDDFKSINDTFGHLVGDKVLEKTANALKETLTPESRTRTCRFGGDEFAVVFKHDDYNTSLFFQNFYSILRQEEVPEDLLPYLSLSIGLIDFKPIFDDNLKNNAITVKELFKITDEALYEAKRNGKNQIIQKSYTIPMVKNIAN
ncbi:GGDEF domain-containing protein [Vagococcus fluvialis]|uniref:GGDEF domain-containing protein n=1 Tax=Vagococcus fluvialis TaxID=2738 RepID=UPI001D0BDCC3|nr:GGDEF domain-containing protein [Vagococcus fluvialis]UDM75348.1 GGDEF domain-containing protein [Vagococcus fluvialis]